MRTTGFRDPKRRLKVLIDQVEVCLDPNIYSAYVVDGYVYLKQSSKEIPFVTSRKIVFDFDDTLTTPDSEPPYKLYFQKAVELNPYLASKKDVLNEIFSKASGKFDPTEEMERLERILKICSFTKKQHEEAVCYALDNTMLVPGLQTALIDIRNMQIEPYIVSGSNFDYLKEIVKRFVMQIPPKRICGSHMHFNDAGVFESFDWLLGYRKSDAINALYNRREHLQIIVSDNPISDFPMHTPYFDKFVDYGINLAIWLSEPVDLPLHVRVFKPELRKDFSQLQHIIRAYDRAKLMTDLKTEEEWQRLVNYANDLLDQANYIMRCPTHILQVALEDFSINCRLFLQELRPLFSDGEKIILRELGKLQYKRNPTVCRQIVKEVIDFFKAHVREFSVPRNFLSS